MKEETQETRERISYHKFRIQLAIEEYWDFLAKHYAKDELTESRYNHLKTFPERFIEFEKNKEQER